MGLFHACVARLNMWNSVVEKKLIIIMVYCRTQYWYTMSKEITKVYKIQSGPSSGEKDG